MDTKTLEKEIYNRTNGGLDIIKRFFPEVNEQTAFKLRESERTASARLWKKDNIYLIKDFGSNEPALSPIRLIMHQTNKSYWEAINSEADRLGLNEKKVTTTPKITKVATTDEDSLTHVESSEFTPDDLRFWGVPDKVLLDYGWNVCVSYTQVKNGTKLTVASTDNYRMYVRNCGDFYKIYKPQDNVARFMIIGTKPDGYIHGLQELSRKYSEHNKKTEQEEKLPSAVICSGERDAMIAASRGCYPIWKNSETEKLTKTQVGSIYKYVDTIYNIPDIDTTGIKCGKELALQFPTIRTAWLPSWLSTYYNNGKKRKDLRDWADFKTQRNDFSKLLNTAMPAKFWFEDENEKGQITIKIIDRYFYNFLSLLDFCKYADANKQEYHARINKNVVYKTTWSEVKEAVNDWLYERGEDNTVLNAVFKYCSKTGNLDNLNIVSIDNSYFGEDWQIFQFQNKQIKVNSTDITETTIPIHFFENQVIKHNYKKMEPSFKATENDIEILHTKSHFFRYLINTSRIFWRTEYEERAKSDSNYIIKNKFNIAGELLTAEEVKQQKKILLNKMFAIGYLFHRYKDIDNAFAPWLMEYNVLDTDEAKGGTGKSFFMESIMKFIVTVDFNGRNKDLTNDKFLFDRINERTSIMLVSDAERHLDFNFWYNLITNNMVKQAKYGDNQTILFHEAPKLAFTSNFAPPIAPNDDSSMRRILFCLMSDYYHAKTDRNDYLENRTISDDFGYKILTYGYPEEYWSEDIYFFLECLKYYLQIRKKGIKKIEPDLTNVLKRIDKQNIGDNFNYWADTFFSTQDSYDVFLSRRELLHDYSEYIGGKKPSVHNFTKRLEVYCKSNNIIMNPDYYYKNEDGTPKRVRKIFDNAPNYGKMDDCLYFTKTAPKPPVEEDDNDITLF